MNPANTTDLTVPPALAAEIQAAADEERRPVLDVLRDAVAGYREEQRWRRVLAHGADQTRALGVTEDDVSRLIAEHREEKRRARPSA